MTPTLETERLLLRPVRQGDALASRRLMDRHVARYLVSFTSSMTLEQWSATIAAARKALGRREDVVFAVLDKAGKELIGWTGLARDRSDPELAHLGYWLGAAFEGQGYMNEAVTAFLPMAVFLLRAKAIEGAVHPDNPASIALLQKQGFRLDRPGSIRFPASGIDEDIAIYKKTVG